VHERTTQPGSAEVLPVSMGISHQKPVLRYLDEYTEILLRIHRRFIAIRYNVNRK
jgi:hypothetical protein